MFDLLPQSRARKKKAIALYEALRAQSRLPIFYERYAVPDTVDGRFEMLAVHCYLVMRRLNAAGEKKLAQKLFDVFFRQIEKNLREMGIGDLGVPKHMKRMMNGFNGRASHYEAAILTDNDTELKQAIRQNIYGTVDTPNDQAMLYMCAYIKANAEVESIDATFTDPSLEDEKYG
jgi:cytochrome b pre-mRNA-processing protein 3